ncbi:hypothetical protein C725_2928 [Pacificimonas flava]|uniref:Uncharacterized protein n=1 Tax=Pacificimonas flava TaxID=1234595 RepID=M2S8G8_9SPHN|nr:hypothetical protein C725_2928 [Pacificimonas flava]
MKAADGNADTFALVTMFVRSFFKIAANFFCPLTLSLAKGL